MLHAQGFLIYHSGDIPHGWLVLKLAEPPLVAYLHIYIATRICHLTRTFPTQTLTISHNHASNAHLQKLYTTVISTAEGCLPRVAGFLTAAELIMAAVEEVGGDGRQAICLYEGLQREGNTCAHAGWEVKG